MLHSVLIIFVGGFIGGLLRWALTRLLPARPATFSANILGSAILGLAVAAPGIAAPFCGVGLAGALSTWSTLANQLADDVDKRRWWPLCRYLGVTIAACLAAAGLSHLWAEQLIFT